MEKSESIVALATALAIAQGKFEPIKRIEKVDFITKTGGRKKYNYAPLEEVINACRKALADNGLSILQLTTKSADNKFVLETLILHKSGEWIKGEMDVAAYPADAQQQGSVLTYARRYALSAMLGVASEEDDDGEAATEQGKIVPASQSIQKPAKAMPATANEHFCMDHNVPYQEYKGKDGKATWWSHKLADGKYCNEHKQKVKTFEEHPEELFGDEPSNPATKAVTMPSGATATPTGPLDMDWLREILNTKEKKQNVLRFIKESFNVIDEKVSDAVKLLTPEQQKELGEWIEEGMK